jgi:hypothetical protein
MQHPCMMGRRDYDAAQQAEAKAGA